jgi:hypothetical protein
MKTLGTIVLSLVAIVASLVLVLSSICAYTSPRGSYFICALIALAVVVAAMSAIGRLNRKT